MPQPWPWVKYIQYISQTHIFFVPNIKSSAQTVLTREGKVVAAVDTDAADAADAGDAVEMNWKHKVTPDQGDLMNEKYFCF